MPKKLIYLPGQQPNQTGAYKINDGVAPTDDATLGEHADQVNGDMSQIGSIIGAVMAKGDGIDGSLVSKLVREKIS